MRDPDHDEMSAFLKSQWDGDECADDAEVAIYWFANDWHGGQSTNLYSALSTSVFDPGPIATLESEGEQVRMMYLDLELEYMGAERAEAG